MQQCYIIYIKTKSSNSWMVFQVHKREATAKKELNDMKKRLADVLGEVKIEPITLY